MLKYVRQTIVTNLWEKYCSSSAEMQLIAAQLQKKNILRLPLDHFAIIDLPSVNTGIDQLKKIFSAIGYHEQGHDYLPDKQNDFLWMAEADSKHAIASDVLPQVVVADFRLDELPVEIKNIIVKYAKQAPASPLTTIQTLASDSYKNHEYAAKRLITLIIAYLAGRDWSLPTTREFLAVQEFNELLAWVLLFGRKPNHFTLAIHLLGHFDNLAEFHQFITTETSLTLNHEGGIIKGGQQYGIAQSSTKDCLQVVKLADGEIKLSCGFVEFVWRYRREPAKQQQPIIWSDFYTGFVAKHANHVIESLYN